VYFYSFVITSIWRRAIPFISLKDDLCRAWLKLALWIWRRFLKDPTLFFTFLLLFTLWKGPSPLFKKNLKSLQPRKICTTVGWFWPAGSGEEDFWNFIVYLLLSYYYLPLENGYLLRLNKLKSPSLKDDLCQVWLNLA
jgi:hypothetical protein